ncbi:MAG: YfcE family phosphodiesterase [Fusobacteriaceae bacterium]
MNILVISDSHGELSNIIKVYELEQPDLILSAGDCLEDIKELSYIYKGLRYESVRGNCDYFTDILEQNKLLEVCEKKIFLTHGHLYGVKSDLRHIEEQGEELGVNIVVFGHTHRPYLNKVNEIFYFNPGAMIEGKYGIISIKKNQIDFFQKQI